MNPADASKPPRAPRVFDPSDPALMRSRPPDDRATTPIRDLVLAGEADEPPSERSGTRSPEATEGGPGGVEASQPGASAPAPVTAPPSPGFFWTKLLFSSLLGLALLAAGVSAGRFITAALDRDDWIGWTATGLGALAAVALIVIVAREILGILRLTRLRELRRETAAALASHDPAAEDRALLHLQRLYRARPDLRWALARLKNIGATATDAHSLPGDRLRAAERELLVPLDAAARRLILRSARRIATVTTLSPLKTLTIGYVLIENVKLLGAIAGLYGGRPGPLGALRLIRLVSTHLIATGGLALTDDLLGQMLGHTLLRRVSARLGEGAFNGALTARVGAAGVEVCRPLPFLEAKPVRARDVLVELFKKERAAAQ